MREAKFALWKVLLTGALAGFVNGFFGAGIPKSSATSLIFCLISILIQPPPLLFTKSHVFPVCLFFLAAFLHARGLPRQLL